MKNKTTEELVKKLIEIKKEEQLIMLELWKRCPNPIESKNEVLKKVKGRYNETK